MTLLNILLFTAFALLVGWLVPLRWRGWFLMVSSVLAVFWLQPSTPIRNLDFWFPLASIGLTIFVWAVTRTREVGDARADLAAAGVIVGIILAVAISRYTGPVCCLTPTRPPSILLVILGMLLIAACSAAAVLAFPRKQSLSGFSILLIIALFIVVKSEPLAQAASAGLRSAIGQSPGLASFLDLRWLGFSYLAFRLLHVLRDHQTGKLPAYSLNDFVVYALFFPAYTAGPIDRSQHFIPELHKVEKGAAQAAKVPAPASARALGIIASAPAHRLPAFPMISMSEGGWRIFLGVFKKFVLADSLALVALNGQNAAQTTSTAWTWLLLYAYTLRIYFDFSGYTDIALGLARLLGLTLPENFTAPYLKTNLTAFWNSWHITLAQWFRAYVFNPFTRSMRSSPAHFPVWSVVLCGQLLTMLLIGLWHGITWPFAIWGLWHGLGLFVHNRWVDWTRSHPPFWSGRPRAKKVFSFLGWLLTFQYVALGWVWFAMPNIGLAIDVFKRLFGF